MSSPQHEPSSPHQYPQAYRPGDFAPSPAERASMNAAMAPPPNTTGPIEQVWAPGQQTSNRPLLQIIGIAAGLIGMIVVITIVMSSTGVGETTAGFVLALIPLTIVLAGVLWLDRWEPEPKLLLLTALMWGAGVSTLSSLVINTSAQQWFYDSTGDAQQAVTLGTVVVAPVVEEFFKGLGVLLLFLVRRNHFDGPVDGVVYAATVAAGFAFTENILYFAQNSSFIWSVFVMRGLVSPFAHLIFTACIGIAIGMAARSRRTTTVLLAFPVGLVGAMGLHALWNGSSMLGNFFVLFLVIQIPLFIAVIVLMFWLRRQEAEVIRARLGEYAQAGWFAPHEVEMLSSMRMRSQARAWAAGYGERAKQAMKEFQRDSTSLAYLRQRQLTGRAELKASQSEHELLNEIQRDRHTFTMSAQGIVQQQPA
jgi:RsiW-degrading membrane proteinase PrsW (M82 family)